MLLCGNCNFTLCSMKISSRIVPCMHICTYSHAHTCTCMHLHICVYIYVNIHPGMEYHLFFWGGGNIDTPCICMYVHSYSVFYLKRKCRRACLRMCTTFVRRHINICILPQICIYIYTCMVHTHAYTYIYIYTYNTYKHVGAHAHGYANIVSVCGSIYIWAETKELLSIVMPSLVRHPNLLGIRTLEWALKMVVKKWEVLWLQIEC